MSAMMSFCSWFIAQLPSFLLSDPISAFTGLAILSCVISVTRRIIHM